MTVPSLDLLSQPGRVSPGRRTAIACCFLLAAAAPAVFPRPPDDDVPRLLREIYDEVRTMSARPGEPFIRQEFFIGEDDDDTYKDIAVSIVLPESETPPVMIVQFTWMERDRRDRRVAVARSTKILRCVMDGEDVRLEGEAFANEELPFLARGLLKAVRDKKRLLRKAPSRGSAEPREYPSKGHPGGAPGSPSGKIIYDRETFLCFTSGLQADFLQTPVRAHDSTLKIARGVPGRNGENAPGGMSSRVRRPVRDSLRVF